MNKWKKTDLEFKPAYHEALLQQHHALQLLTMAAKSYVPEKEDDSHTSLDYEERIKSLIGLPLNGIRSYRLGLRLTDLTIMAIDNEGDVVEILELNDLTKNEAVTNLKGFLESLGFDISKFSSKLHYEIPDHPLDKGQKFDNSNQVSLNQNQNQRQNADYVLKEVAKSFEHASEIKVWPHHFDTGGLIPLEFDENKSLTKSIGIGFAIPDSMVNEPYFYLSYWSADQTKQIKDPNPFSTKGIWKTPDWQGAVLPMSQIDPAEDNNGQAEIVQSFFREGIDFLINM